MRKIFLTALTIAVGAGCLPMAANDTPDILNAQYFSVFPGKYTKDGKPFLFTYGREYGRGIVEFHIYDENMQLIKQIGPIDPQVYESKIFTQSRTYAYEYAEPRGSEYEYQGQLEINGESTGLSIDRVQSYLFAMYGHGEIFTMPNGVQVVATGFYGEEMFGKKYPNRYYKEIDGVWKECDLSYEGVNWGPFGDWGEVKEVVDSNTVEPDHLDIIPESGGESEYYRLSSGIFGDDYHYILPVYEAKNFEDNFEYYEKPGWIYEKSWGTRYEQTGFTVCDSNGKEVMSINCPSGYSARYSDLYFFQMGNNRYLGIDEVEDSEENEYLLVYRLESGNSVKFVTAAPSSKVSPRNPKRGENVSVTLDSPVGNDGAMVQVVSASGQTMLNTKIPAGQSRLNINTAGFSQGMYVVTVSGNGTTKEAAKIIVR